MPTLVLLTVRVTESPRGLFGTMISALFQEMAAVKMAAKVNIFLIPSPPLPKDRKLHLVKKRKNSDERLSTGRMMLLRKSPRQKVPEIGKLFVSFSTDYYILLQRSGTFFATPSANRMRIFACLPGPAPFHQPCIPVALPFSERKLSPKNHKKQLQNLFLGHSRHELLQIERLEVSHILGFALRQQFRSRNQH